MPGLGERQSRGETRLPPTVIFGFNTDIRLGKTVFHVQTEDRGRNNPVIDTTIYAQGRVLHKRANSYKELLDTPAFSEALLRQRLEEQHRDIIDELRSGALRFEAGPQVPAPAEEPSGIQVQLLNPASWLAAGTATLKIEVKARASQQPVAGAQLRIMLEGIRGPVEFAARTDQHGRADLSFPLPRLAPGGTELVIRASGLSSEDEIRYSLRPKPKTPVA